MIYFLKVMIVHRPSQRVKLPKGRFETCCYLVVGSGLEMNISLHDGEQVGATGHELSFPHEFLLNLSRSQGFFPWDWFGNFSGLIASGFAEIGCMRHHETYQWKIGRLMEDWNMLELGDIGRFSMGQHVSDPGPWDRAWLKNFGGRLGLAHDAAWPRSATKSAKPQRPSNMLKRGGAKAGSQTKISVMPWLS